MIEKTISYEEVKPSKPKNIKPVEQGGRLNYLGKQKTITVPVKWKSGPTHPETHLAYITKQEQDILVKLDLYKSMNGKPNKGPFGLPSLNDGDGSGGGDGGSSGGSGGSGGSDASGDAGNATGDSAGVGGSGEGTSGEGSGSGPGGESGTGGTASAPGSFGGSEEGFGIGPDAEAEAAAAANEQQSMLDSYKSFVQENINKPMENVKSYVQNLNPVNTVLGMVTGIPGLGLALNALQSYQRGVTGPNDYSQEETSVQTQSPTAPSTGIATIQQYAPAYNQDTGNPTMDAYMRQLRINLGLPV
jgi:hypothetical protein